MMRLFIYCLVYVDLGHIHLERALEVRRPPALNFEHFLYGVVIPNDTWMSSGRQLHGEDFGY